MRNFCLIPVLSVCGFVGVVFPAETSKRPNILFCIADDASYAHFGANGCRWVNTPTFDRVAREGVRFTRAYTPNAKCAPSRSAILTGRNPWQLEAAANHQPIFPAKFQTYGEALAEKGYYVAISGKGWGPGRALDETGKRRNMVGVSYDRFTYEPLTPRMCKIDFGQNFEAFMREKPKNQPWFFWLGSTDPHRTYEYGSGVRHGKKLSDIDRVPDCWPDTEEVRNDMLDYALEIENFDQNVARTLDVLEKSGEMDNTLIIITSDNGMPFPYAKGNLYPLATHMPLAMMWKNGIAAPGRTVDDFVSFIDFAPTILDVAGIAPEDTKMHPFAGESLMPVFVSENSGRVVPHRNRVILGRERTDLGRPHDAGYPIRAIIRDNLIYLHNFEPTRWPGANPETGYRDTDDGPTKTAVLESRDGDDQHRFWQRCYGFRPKMELFDLDADPYGTNNLAPTQTAKCDELREELFAVLKAQEDPRMLGQGHIFDEYPHHNELLRGYYERWLATEGADPEVRKQLLQKAEEDRKKAQETKL